MPEPGLLFALLSGTSAAGYTVGVRSGSAAISSHSAHVVGGVALLGFEVGTLRMLE